MDRGRRSVDREVDFRPLYTYTVLPQAVTRALAARLGQDVELWGLTGLLHDLDYDIVGDDRQLHARLSVDILCVGGCLKLPWMPFGS